MFKARFKVSTDNLSEEIDAYWSIYSVNTDIPAKSKPTEEEASTTLEPTKPTVNFEFHGIPESEALNPNCIKSLCGLG